MVVITAVALDGTGVPVEPSTTTKVFAALIAPMVRIPLNPGVPPPTPAIVTDAPVLKLWFVEVVYVTDPLVAEAAEIDLNTGFATVREVEVGVDNTE